MPSPPATTATPRSTTWPNWAPKHWATVHLWTIICLAAGVLCSNERTYLHDDLKEVNIPEWDETELM